jgi:hypothetical protein
MNLNLMVLTADTGNDALSHAGDHSSTPVLHLTNVGMGFVSYLVKVIVRRKRQGASFGMI